MKTFLTGSFRYNGNHIAERFIAEKDAVTGGEHLWCSKVLEIQTIKHVMVLGHQTNKSCLKEGYFFYGPV